MQAVTISIQSEQQFDTHKDVIKQEFCGKLKKIGHSQYIIHEHEGIQTMYKTSPNRLFVKRSGEVEQTQEFSPGKKLLSTYKNNGLTLEIGTYTEKLHFMDLPGMFVIHLEYLLYINEDLHGKTIMTITITERTEH